MEGKEKIPGKGFVLAGAVLLAIAGVVLLFSALSQIPDLKEVLNSDLLPDKVKTVLQVSIFFDPLRGVVAIATAVISALCFLAPRKWVMPAMIAAIAAIVIEFAGIALYYYVSYSLGSNEKFQYSLALLGGLIVVVGLGKMKTKFREDAKTSV